MDELFAERLTYLIKNNDYILSDLEEIVGKKAATISRYASGEIKGVKRSTIVKLADFFNVSPAWLAGLSDKKYDNDVVNNYSLYIKEQYGENSVNLLDNYNKLNDLGKQTADIYLEDLTTIEKYTKKNEANQANG